MADVCFVLTPVRDATVNRSKKRTPTRTFVKFFIHGEEKYVTRVQKSPEWKEIVCFTLSNSTMENEDAKIELTMYGKGFSGGEMVIGNGSCSLHDVLEIIDGEEANKSLKVKIEGKNNQRVNCEVQISSTSTSVQEEEEMMDVDEEVVSVSDKVGKGRSKSVHKLRRRHKSGCSN